MKYLKLFEMYDGENHEKDYMNRSSIERKKEIEEVSEYLKDIFSEVSDDFSIKCQDSSKYLRSSDIKITINLLKKSPEFKKSDGSDDWSKFKQSTFNQKVI